MGLDQIFTIEEGLRFQAIQLTEWESLIKPEHFERLKKECEERNKKAMKSGNDVFRGVSMQNWVFNNLMITGDYYQH